MRSRAFSRIRVTREQLTEIMSTLGAVQRPDRLDLRGAGAQMDEVSQGAAAEDLGDHLSEEICICYRMNRLTDQERQRAARHLERCEECAGQIRRLEEFAYLWSDPEVLRRLSARFQSSSPPQKPQWPHWNRGGAGRLPLGPLLMPSGAYGSDAAEGPISLDFSVTADGETVAALSGQVQRRGKEYYVRVRITDPEQRALEDRKVALILANAPDCKPFLHRNVDVGVAVLLGTDLELTDHSYMEAHLLPGENVDKG